jgi:small subunit ribosomal protein S4
MITGTKFRMCRRLGPGVFEKCQTPKFAASQARRAGRKSDKRPKQPTEFGLQLIEKQKIRFSYGVKERQFSNYVKDATEKGGANAADRLYESLESRVDNVVYRLGLAHTRPLARQMVSHGHFTINGVKTTIASTQLKAGDVVKVRDGSKGKALFADVAAKAKEYTPPEWLKYDLEKLEAKVSGKPKKNDNFLDFSTVLEFYSR